MKKVRCAIYTRKSAEEGLEQQGVNVDNPKRARSEKPRKQPRECAYVRSPEPAKRAGADTAGCLPG